MVVELCKGHSSSRSGRVRFRKGPRRCKRRAIVMDLDISVVAID